MKNKQSWMGTKLDEEISEDKINQDVIDEVVNEHERGHRWGWQRVVDKVIRFTPIQIVLLVLALLDVAVVITEILILLHIYMTQVDGAHKALNETMYTLNQAMHTQHHYLQETLHDVEGRLSNLSESVDEDSVTSSLDNDVGHLVYFDQMTPHENKSLSSVLVRRKRSSDGDEDYETGLKHSPIVDILHKTERILNLISIVILGIFVVVVFLEVLVEGSHFCKDVMKIIDAIVTILSFILDVVKFSKVLSKEVMNAIIVILLLWQIVRMFNGIMLSEIKRLEFRIKLQKRARKKLDVKLKELQKEKGLVETEVKSLQNLSRRKGVSEDDIAMCRPVRISAKPSASAGLSMIAMMTMGLTVEDDMMGDMKHKKGDVIPPLTNLQIAPLPKSPTAESRLSGKTKDEKGMIIKLEKEDISTEDGSSQEPSSSKPPSYTSTPSFPPMEMQSKDAFDIDTKAPDTNKYPSPNAYNGNSGEGKTPECGDEERRAERLNVVDNGDSDDVELSQETYPPVYIYKPVWKDHNDDGSRTNDDGSRTNDDDSRTNDDDSRTNDDGSRTNDDDSRMDDDDEGANGVFRNGWNDERRFAKERYGGDRDELGYDDEYDGRRDEYTREYPLLQPPYGIGNAAYEPGPRGTPEHNALHAHDP